jgi:spore maturation protein CgeB
MRIYYAADTSPNPELHSTIWRKNLFEGLAQLGHEVIESGVNWRLIFRHLDPTSPENAEFINEHRPKLSECLAEEVRRLHQEKPFDLFFSYFYSACVLPEVLKEIRSLGIVTLNWYCNASYQFHLVSEIAPHFDWCLVPEKDRLDSYREIGARPIYCPEAANPNLYRPLRISARYDATFVGQAYGERPILADFLIRQGINLRLFGPRWEYYTRSSLPKHLTDWPAWFRTGRAGLPRSSVGGVLADEEVIQVFNQTRVNLGFSACWNEDHDRRILQIRLRDFEVPMCGGFYLVEYQGELENFFIIGTEIECYRDREELRDKVRFYLDRPELRTAIGQAARQRCLREHTWSKRFERVFREIGLPGRGAKSLLP